MEIIDEQPETIEEIKKLEETMFHEVEHALNDIDSQIMSLLVQRKIQANLLNNIICKYNKPLSNINLNKNVLNRINTQYNNDKTYLTNVYSTIL
jgi:UDP-galactopyranose mutase